MRTIYKNDTILHVIYGYLFIKYDVSRKERRIMHMEEKEQGIEKGLSRRNFLRKC